jgi:glucokinase
MGASRVLDNILTLIATLQQQCGADETIRGVGIGTPGFVDTNGVMIGGAKNIPGWAGTDIASPIRERFGLDVTTANDVTVAALGEARFGAGKHADNMLCVALGTGIGGGIVVNQTVYKGSHGMAGEIGHIVVEENGQPCTCGMQGCVEQYASATGVITIARQHASRFANRSELARDIAAHPDTLTAKTVYDHVRTQDPLAVFVHEYACRMLGKCFGMLLNTLAVDTIVITGGLSASADLIIPGVSHYVPRWCWHDIWERCTIVPGALGDSAGALGAAMLVFEEIDPHETV